jgi:hypothetical protein
MTSLEYLRKWSGIISVSAIEKEIGCPGTTIAHAMTGKRKLPEKWEKLLDEKIKEIRK